MTIQNSERKISRVVNNTYRTGSLPWVERNRANAYRDVLYRLAYGDITREEAREEFYALETDSASF